MTEKHSITQENISQIRRTMQDIGRVLPYLVEFSHSIVHTLNDRGTEETWLQCNECEHRGRLNGSNRDVNRALFVIIHASNCPFANLTYQLRNFYQDIDIMGRFKAPPSYAPPVEQALNAYGAIELEEPDDGK